MTDKQLYDLFGIKPYVEPVRAKRDVIISNEASSLFKLAAKAIEQNHKHFSISYTNMMLTEYKDNIIVKYTIFVSSNNLEIIRGVSHDTCYVDSNLAEDKLRDLKMLYFPCFKEIIMLDKQDKQE